MMLNMEVIRLHSVLAGAPPSSSEDPQSPAAAKQSNQTEQKPFLTNDELLNEIKKNPEDYNVELNKGQVRPPNNTEEYIVGSDDLIQGVTQVRTKQNKKKPSSKGRTSTKNKPNPPKKEMSLEEHNQLM